MKKSLEQAKKSAIEHSKQFPDIIVYVMDKPKKRAVVSTVEWVVKQRVFEGYSTVAKYKNGEEVNT